MLVKGLHEAGWMVDNPKASMYVWAKIPEPYRAMGSLEFTKKLLAQAKVSVSPGIGFGEYGDGYVRFAMIENESAHAPGDPRHQADVPRRRRGCDAPRLPTRCSPSTRCDRPHERTRWRHR